MLVNEWSICMYVINHSCYIAIFFCCNVDRLLLGLVFGQLLAHHVPGCPARFCIALL